LLCGGTVLKPNKENEAQTIGVSASPAQFRFDWGMAAWGAGSIAKARDVLASCP
jgi:hypothetical protein